MAYKGWVLRFPRMACPHCKRTISVAYRGGRYQFWRVGPGRPKKAKTPFGITESSNGFTEGP